MVLADETLEVVVEEVFAAWKGRSAHLLGRHRVTDADVGHAAVTCD